MSLRHLTKHIRRLSLAILLTSVLPSLGNTQVNACFEFYEQSQYFLISPAELAGLQPSQQRQYSEFIAKGYEFKIRKYRSPMPPHKVFDFYVVTKFPPGTMIERLARSIKYVTGVEVVFDFLQHQSGNRGWIDFKDKLIFLSSQNLSSADGLPTPTLLHELHHVMNRHLSLYRRDINLGNALFISSDATASKFQSAIRNYAKVFYLDELSAARLTDNWRKKSEDPESNLFGSDEGGYKEPASDLNPISEVVWQALSEKRYEIEYTHVDAFNPIPLVRHGKTEPVMPLTKTHLKLYDQDGTFLGKLILELPKLTAYKMLGMSPEKQSQKKWSKFEVEREIAAFVKVLEHQLSL